MSDLRRFLERNQGRFQAGRHSLFINLPADALATSNGPIPGEAHCFFQDFDVFQSCLGLNSHAEFGAFPERPTTYFKEVVLTLPREKALFEAWLDWCANAIMPDGALWVAGENRAGIRSANKLLATHFVNVEKVDSARHCSLYRASGPVARAPFSVEHLFSEWDFKIAGQRYPGASLPGVFSHERLDDGTRLLLESLSGLPFAGKLLDFGCGSGVISAFLGAQVPGLELTLVDNNGLALVSSQRTLELNHVEGHVMPSNGLSEVSGKFDTIVSNPPFHRGVHTKSGMSMAMLQPVRNFLAARGQLIVVVNRHLPYRSWLQELFGQCETLAQNGRFSVLSARNSP